MTKRILIGLLVLAPLVVVAAAGVPFVSRAAQLLLVALALAVLLLVLWRLLRRSLWKVGRRLAFSYFLIGVLPIPLSLLLLSAAAYLLSGFLVGHLYQDAAAKMSADLERAAQWALASPAAAAKSAGGDGAVSAVYRDGRRVAGDDRLPATWPGSAWAAGGTAAVPGAGPAYFAGPAGAPTLAATAGDSRAGALAVWSGDLAAELSRRSEVWVEISRAAERDADGSPMKVQVGPYEIAMQRPATAERAAEADAFFAALAGIKPGEHHSWWDRPLLLWTEAPRPVRSLADGSPVGGDVAVSLNATPRTVRRHLFSSSAEFDAKVWGALLALAFLLFDVFVVATLMAMVMIFTLSRAFNRLSRATAAVATGNFGVRIPVKRNDQVGALQRSFNDMAEHLEELVEANAGKELIEKELAIARDLQQSLLPRNLPAGDSVEFSLLFAPSAAIGGDYFDVFHLGEGRLAVVVADVSGHGLPTGLRMAMVKAALTILVEEGKSPEEILRRLDAVVRADDDRRLFVTATLARVDLEAGTVEITNAGHPPTYLVRGGEVEEISLPGSPLGGLDQRYGQREVGLEPGDVVVWLSDGLIEATDRRSDAFGYEGVKQALGAGPATTAAMVRDRLLAAVETHTQGRPIEDDRTVVVMRYIGRPSATAGAAAGAGSDGGVRGSR